MSKLVWMLAGAIALCIVAGILGVFFMKTGVNGFSARVQPGVWETWMARQLRSMAVPAGARQRQNPVPDSPEVLAEASAHWADHCAGCHANNGSGDTVMGKHMYPPAPEMRQDDTQHLSDGELFYIVQNGIRFTGMPAWATAASHDEEDSWKLVRFIRHLPKLSAEEEHEMESLNPKTPDELKEEQEEKEFLNGGPTREHHEHQQEHHHH